MFCYGYRYLIYINDLYDSFKLQIIVFISEKVRIFEDNENFINFQASSSNKIIQFTFQPKSETIVLRVES